MQFETVKGWLSSKTLLSTIVRLAAFVVGLFGIQVDEPAQAVTMDQLHALAGVVLWALSEGLTIWGRKTASTPVSLTRLR